MTKIPDTIHYIHVYEVRNIIEAPPGGAGSHLLEGPGDQSQCEQHIDVGRGGYRGHRDEYTKVRDNVHRLPTEAISEVRHDEGADPLTR